MNYDAWALRYGIGYDLNKDVDDATTHHSLSAMYLLGLSGVVTLSMHIPVACQYDSTFGTDVIVIDIYTILIFDLKKPQFTTPKDKRQEKGSWQGAGRVFPLEFLRRFVSRLPLLNTELILLPRNVSYTLSRSRTFSIRAIV